MMIAAGSVDRQVIVVVVMRSTTRLSIITKASQNCRITMIGTTRQDRPVKIVVVPVSDVLLTHGSHERTRRLGCFCGCAPRKTW